MGPAYLARFKYTSEALMNWNRLAVICALSWVLCRSGMTQADDPAAGPFEQHGRADEIACHGLDIAGKERAAKRTRHDCAGMHFVAGA